MQLTPFHRVPGVTDIPHGWTLRGDRLTVVATADIDVDAMPPHVPYSYFGEHRSDMAPGPARIALAVTVDAKCGLGLRKHWSPAGEPLFASPAAWEDWARGGESEGPRSSVTAPFAVASAALAHSGLLGGLVPFATGTLDLIGAAHGARARALAEASMAEAGVAFEFLVGPDNASRLRRAAVAGWFPGPREMPYLLSPQRRPEDVDLTMGAARRWPFLRAPLIKAFCTAAALAEGLDSPLVALATKAMGKGATRTHLARVSPHGQRLKDGDPEFLAGLPVDWIPAEPDDAAWPPLLRLASTVGVHVRHTGVSPATACRDSKGRWAEYEARLIAAALPGAEGGTLAGVSSHLNDMAMSCLRTLVGPAFALRGRDGIERRDGSMASRTWGMNMGGGFRLVMGRGALMSLAERAGRFQGRRDGMRAALRATSPEAFADLVWDAHLPRWRDPATGLDIVPLVDERELRADGSARPGEGGLSHCVGDYGWICANGSSRIVSVRRRSGEGFERLSTAEIKWAPDGSLVVPQHNGRANGAPPAESARAFGAYMEMLSRDRPARPAAVGNRNKPSERTVQAGYDPTREENVALALRLWHPMLPRELRVDTVLEFVDAARRMGAALTATPALAPRVRRDAADAPEEASGPRP